MQSGPNHLPPPPYVMVQDQGAPGSYPGPHGRNPPRFNGQYRPNGQRKNSCMRCYCCFYCCIFITLVVIIAGVVISLVLISPTLPKYNIDNFSVKAFNLTSDFNLYAHFVVTVKADNPNKKISIIYGKDSSVKLTYSGVQLCSGAIPDFHQPTRNTTMINVDMEGDLKQSDFGGSLGQSLMEKIKSDRIPLDVAVRIPVNIEIAKVRILKDPMGIYVKCSMVVNNLSKPDKNVQISDKKCDNFSFSYKFKK